MILEALGDRTHKRRIMKDKVILITGASSGIGESTAKRLAGAGAKVALLARRGDRLEKLKNEIESKGGKALVVECDVTRAEDMKKAAEKTRKELGGLDVLINNAGLMPLSKVEKLRTDEWDQMVDVNIKGVLNGVAAVLPYLKEQKSGHIINVASSAAHNYFPGGAVYCATKAAVKMFTEGLRQEVAPTYGIRVTSVEPGYVDTELQDSIKDDEIKKGIEDMGKKITTLEAEDIAEAIHYALAQNTRANVNAVFVMPTEQQK
tara:strand:- start:100 stop:885 length:786 start_codon:yes stop_codon:yes gene_type:complete